MKKHLGVVVKYFSRTQNEVISTFLGLSELESSDAEGIVTSLVALLKDSGLQIRNLSGIGTDNAFVMTGINASVYKILKEKYDLKHLILVRCVCHSIQLAVSHASVDTVPRQVEFLIRETHNWFKISSKRQPEYRTLYESLNCGEKPLKILKTCDTRWLSIEPAITRILSQWRELTLHFEKSRLSDNCYKAEMLYQMFKASQNELYLQFLRCVLDETQSALKIFEQKSADPTLLFNTLQDLIKKLCLKIIISQACLNFNSLDVTRYLSPNPYLGYIFETKLQESNLPNDIKNGIKERCVNFVIKLISQLQQRLPENLKCLKNSSCLSVTKILKPTRSLQEIVHLCESFGYAPEEIDKIVEQWRTIILQEWVHKGDTVKFWSEVKDSKDASSTSPYKEIFSLAMKVFSLPHSNADIERVFSTMNVIKNKLRNSLCLDTINAILHVRYGLVLKKSNCANYKLPNNVLRKISSTDKYKFKTKLNHNQPSTSGSSAGININEEEIQESDDDENLTLIDS